MLQQQLSQFVSPATQPLDDIQAHLLQVSTAYHDVTIKLRSHVSNLMMGSQGFQGTGAHAFSTLMEYYIGAVDKHCQALDSGANAAKTCQIQINQAVDTASSAHLDTTIVAYVLGRLTLDDVIQHGGNAVDPIMQDMQQTWKQMQQTWSDLQNTWQHEDTLMNDANNAADQEWKDLFSLNFGGVGSDISRYWSDQWQKLGDWWHEGGDYLQLAGEGLHMAWDAIQLVWQTLRQWAEDIFQAVKHCLSFISSIETKAIQDITAFISGTVQDVQRLVDDVQKGDYNAALKELLNDFINPELRMAGLQPLSQSQLQEMLPPGFWQWFKSLPTWAKVLALGVVVLMVIGILLWGAISGGKSTDQQRKMNRIRARLAAEGVTVTNAQIEALLKAGYSEDQIYYILKTADLTKSANLFITDYAGRKVYGHTLSLHVKISNTDLKKRALTDQRLRSTFKDQQTAQNAVNYAIANSSALQDFITNGAAGHTATDTVCYHSQPLPNLGYGYQPVPPLPSQKVERVGPLHCMQVTLAKTILGIIFVLTSFPVPG